MKKILACIDGSTYSESVCDHAAWVSARTGAAVELLHVLPDAPESASPADLSGAIGVDASSGLLDRLAEQDEARGRLELRKGREILNHGEERLRAGGVQNITSLKRRGALVDTIREFEAGKDMIIIGKRGELAGDHAMHISPNLERIARAVHRPLLVTPDQFRPVHRFLIAFDGSTGSTRALEYVIRKPLLKGVECHVVTVGRESDGPRRSLDSAVESLERAGFDVTASVETGHPDEMIRAYVDSRKIDLLAIGAYGHSRIRSLITGSTTTSVVMSCPIPLLLCR